MIDLKNIFNLQKILNFLFVGNKFNIIPILTKIFIILVIGRLSIGNQIKYTILLGFLSFLSSNMLRLLFPDKKENTCTNDNTKALPIGVVIEQILNSLIQYGFGIIIPKLIVFIPVVGVFLKSATKIPVLGMLVEFLYWVLGFRVGLTLTTGGFKIPIINFTIGEAEGSICEGKSGMMKKILGLVSFFGILFFEIFNTAKSNKPF